MIPREEHPRPDFKRKEWINLNGSWDFEIDLSNTGIEKKYYLPEKKFKEKIIVPFPPESKLSGIENKDFMVSVWYKRKIAIPENWRNKRIFLNFGAVDFLTNVWINGEKIGTHIGGYTPFRFEITEFLKSENILVVNAYDDNRNFLQPCGKQSQKYNSYGCHYTRVTGIWQTVYLEGTGKNYIKNFRIYPDYDTGRVLFLVEIEGMGNLKVEVYAENEKSVEKEAYGSKFIFLETDIKDFIPWSFENPFLYDVRFSLYSDGKKEDEVCSYFGFRKIEIRDKKIFLNKKPIFMRMVLDQGYYPDGIYTAPDENSIINDIKIAKDMGFNGARLHQKIFEPIFLYWADKLGYLIWGEYPNWGIKNGINHECFGIFVKEWIEKIERDFNHPSIIGWCPLNETSPSQDNELVRTLYRITKNIDKTRPVIDTSGYVHVETDIYDCHNYKQNPEEFKKDFEPFKKNDTIWQNFPQFDAPYKGQPYWVSEYGGIWWDVEGKKNGWGYGERPKTENDFIERYRKLTEILLNHPKICGFCYTQLYDVEQEVNGLYTYSRKPKFNPEIIRKINTQKAEIEK
ncbi:MAG TPA: glycoside hydrolase family 2 TIM barrel-domain containing protein [bacterium]|nr:glycoside hydrolase family 2 TIM barrel-domain containing protein [bacterium]HOM26251.1 glycoside hydrolase family 2 TIM barrel-domain containing protein [bacterium]